MARPSNPLQQYTIKPHFTHGHVYASTQPPYIDEITKKKRYRYIHWGKIVENKFVPGSKYLLATPEERSNLIFPSDLDLSAINEFVPMADIPQSHKDRLYGDIWLLEEIAKQAGVRKDLLSVFEGDKETVDAILTLAMYPYLTSHSYNRVERWQRIACSTSSKILTPKVITLLSQKITEEHRMNFLRLRANRLGKEEICAVDSTSRSAYGSSLTDIRWGKNKDNLPLQQTIEAVVYSLSNHMPIYYRTFPGNMPDSRSFEVLLKDLDCAGFHDYILITDRGYESIRNIEAYIAQGLPMLVCAKTNQQFIMQRIIDLGQNDSEIHSNMKFDLETGLYSRQYDLDYDIQISENETKKADRLKLNLYLDLLRRSSVLVNLEIDIAQEEQVLIKYKEEQTIVKNVKALKDKCKYHNFQIDELTNTIESYTCDEQTIGKKRLLAGYFASITHKLNFTPMEAFTHYNLRDEQEKYFQQMKDQMGADRQRNWSEDGKTGRLFILFVGLILGSQVRHVWKRKLQDKFSSSLEVLDEMRSIRCIENNKRSKSMTPFIGGQIEICKAFDIEIPEGCGKEYKPKKVKESKRRGQAKSKLKNSL